MARGAAVHVADAIRLVMRLAELAVGHAVVPADANPDITGLTEDSRRVAPGYLFVAVPGTALDGHAFLAEAAARGAAAVVVERAGAVPAGVPQIRVPSARAALAELAARFYGHPGDELFLIGFTGTFGKTSTSEILRALLDAGGGRTGVLGSLGARYRGFSESSVGLTTPAPVELQRALRGLKDAGARTVIMEVTSHALRLERARGLRFGGGLLAAIMPGEHTDFHRTYEDYVDAKRLFLRHLTPAAILAYDADNRAARTLAAESAVRAVGFSLEGRDADVQLYDVLVDGRGATFSVAGRTAGADAGSRLHSALLGRGHLRNVALALTYALAAGLAADDVRETLAALRPLRRRMERYEAAGRIVLDDTAAHPDSLRATFDVAALLPCEGLAVVYAIRGNRGIDINVRNAAVLADLAALHGVDALVVTAAADRSGPNDRASGAEIDAVRQALVERGARFVWHDALSGALEEALARTRSGDLIVLVGAQGMDAGKEILSGPGGSLSSAGTT